MTASCGDELVNLYLHHKDIIYLSAHKHSFPDEDSEEVVTLKDVVTADEQLTSLSVALLTGVDEPDESTLFSTFLLFSLEAWNENKNPDTPPYVGPL